MDFRAIVSACAAAGKLADIDDEVEPATIPGRVRDEEHAANHALAFRHVHGTNAAIVGNLYGSAERVCHALAARDYRDLFARLDRAIANPAPLVRRAGGDDEGTFTRAPDLESIVPALRYSSADVGPYLTSAILVVRDPATGAHHACFVRMALAGGNRLVVNPATARVRHIVERTVGAGAALDVAILIGASAEVTLLACVGVPEGVDKLEVAQALGGAALAFDGDGFPVPRGTEYVLTGRIVPTYLREGPVGDQKGLYSLHERNPVCMVDAIRVRHDPLFHSVSSGVSREHVELVTLGPRAVLERVRRDTPELLDYELPFHAGGRLGVLVVADGFRPGALAQRLWTISSVRGFVAVNRDVDARSAAEVLWAIVERARDATRFAFSTAATPGVKPDKFFIDTTEIDVDDWNSRRIEVYRPAG